MTSRTAIVLIVVATGLVFAMGCAAPQPRSPAWDVEDHTDDGFQFGPRRDGNPRIPHGPPTPAQMSKLRQGMPIDEARVLLTARAWPMARSSFGPEPIEIYQVMPKQTWTAYLVYFRNGKLDAVLPYRESEPSDRFDPPLWEKRAALPAMPLPHAGGEAAVICSYTAKARAIAGLDFTAVDEMNKTADGQVLGMRIALGVFNPTIWFSDPSADAARVFDESLRAVKIGMPHDVAIARVRWQPVSSFMRDGVEYLKFTPGYAAPLTLAIRDGVVRGIYALDFTWATDPMWTTLPPASQPAPWQTASSASRPTRAASPAVDRSTASAGRGR